ncbi:MAG: hypothetical protein QG661_2085 [Actinomycetota bacterium]|nr:hypothetical protein [Actinomycetota bacterium]
MKRSILSHQHLLGHAPDGAWGYRPIPDPDGGPEGGGGASGEGSGAVGAAGGGDEGGNSGGTTKTFSQAEVDELVKNRLARETKKYGDYEDLKTQAAELAALKAANATDLEKAVTNATTETRSAVAREFGEKLARGTLKAQLGTRIEDAAKVESLIGRLNISGFVGDDGTVDDAEITKAVDELAPAKGPRRLDLGQGGRGDGPSLDQQIADAQKVGNFQLVIALKQQKARDGASTKS